MNESKSNMKRPRFLNELLDDSPIKSLDSPNKKLKLVNLDRYIPNRQIMNFEYCNSELQKSLHINNPNVNIPSNSLLSAINTLTPKSNRLMPVFVSPAEKDKSCRKTSGMHNEHLIYHCTSSSRKKVNNRILPSKAFRVLDAPNILDDYYLNLLDWGPNNIIAIALHRSVYLWNSETSKVEQLLEVEGYNDDDDVVTSVRWATESNYILAVGLSNGKIQLWDTNKFVQIRQICGHNFRVSSLSWNSNMVHMLSSGSRDTVIINHDIRSLHSISVYAGHEQEVCGLSWSPDGKILGSGGNENLLCIWDVAMSERERTPLSSVSSTHQYLPKFTKRDHQAAVKALAWCPWESNILASGGGTSDRTIRIWNASTGVCNRSVDTGSQVCAMQWNTHHRELLSSHGFSDNQLILWKYPTMTKIKEFRGHTARVLHMGKSPDGCIICTASADETLRFWDIFSSSSESGINSIRSQPGNFHRSEPIPSLGSVISPVTRLRMLENTPNGSLSIR